MAEQQASMSARDEQGQLTINRTVLRKIIEHAADSEQDVVHAQRRVAGAGLGEQGPNARVLGPDQALRIQLQIAVRYPAPIAATVRATRNRIRDDLDRLADCHVRSLDVTVAALVPATTARVE